MLFTCAHSQLELAIHFRPGVWTHQPLLLHLLEACRRPEYKAISVERRGQKRCVKRSFAIWASRVLLKGNVRNVSYRLVYVTSEHLRATGSDI